MLLEKTQDLSREVRRNTMVDEVVRPPGSGRGSGAKVLSVVASMLVGGSFIDDADGLRSGSTAQVLPFAVSAPSTLGTWLRSFTFGHVRQFDRANELALSGAWSVGAAPAVEEMTIDLDSTICEVHGHQKQGAGYGYTNKLGYHPLLAVRDDTGELMACRMRSGSSQRGHLRFVSETLARMRRLTPDTAVTVRADSGFFSYDMLDLIEARGATYSITIAQNAEVKTAVTAIDDKAWKPIAYTRGGEAQVAETTIETGRRDNKGPRELRLVVRRTRLVGPQAELWPDWRHHALITNRTDLDTAAADAYHRAHARVELAIKDLKATALAQCPSGKFSANGAGLACTALAHNLTRWITRLGKPNTPNNSPSQPPPATGSCRCPDGSSTTQAATSCAYPPTGPGPAPSPAHCNRSATCPCSSKHPARGSAPPRHTPKRHQPAPAPNPSPTRPNTPNPA